MKRTSSETDTLSLEHWGDGQDELSRTVRNPRRRFVVQYVQSADAPVTLDELTARVAVWEGEPTPTDGPPRHEIRTSLVRDHLPALDSVGLVRYDAEQDIVVATANTLGAGPYGQQTTPSE